MTENELATIIVDACYKVHKKLGPGLLESAYERILAFELRRRNLDFVRQKSIGISYEGVKIDFGFRADFIVEDKVIIEIKSIEALAPVHMKQLLTYLVFSQLKLGLLVNFNEAIIKTGIRRVVNNFVNTMLHATAFLDSQISLRLGVFA
jgi:GxxExxY protein